MKTRNLFILLGLTTCMAGSVFAQDPIESSNPWEIHLKPYFWFFSIDADSGIGRLNASIDLSFSDVVDYLDFGAMGRLELWKGKWGLMFDGLFMNLGADESFKGRFGLTRFNADVDVRLGMADFAAAYKLIEQPLGDSDQQHLTFEPYGGLRYAYMRQKATLDVAIGGIGPAGTTIGGSQDWVEPFVGGRVRWDLNDKWAFSANADAGGFGIGSASDLLWQWSAMLDYQWSENVSVSAGYRMVFLDYSRGSGPDRLALDMTGKGPVIGMTIVF